MALFPAYASTKSTNNELQKQERWEISNVAFEGNEVSEAQLLASDSEEEIKVQKAEDFQRDDKCSVHSNDDFYLDPKMDRGNLGVSTLYYPGRPQYEVSWPRLGDGRTAGAAREVPAGRKRYFRRRAAADADEGDAAAAEERATAYRRLLEHTPHDVALWHRYIDFQEVCGTAEGALQAARRGVEAAPQSRRLRARLYAAMRRALPAAARVQSLRDLLAAERRGAVRVALWRQLLRALCATVGGAGGAALPAAARAALADTRAAPHAYPALLYDYGVFLRGAGLWEQLVLLIELVAAMNFPQCAAAAFPPPRDPARTLAAERRLQDLEQKAVSSGLPLSAVWVRVERARAAAHWRAPDPAHSADPAELEADPQRAPLPHDVADLLLPVADPSALFHLSVRLLMLAKVPLVGGAGWTARLPGDDGALHAVEELLPALEAAAALPAAHRAHLTPADARSLLAHFVEPPHYFSDDHGYVRWTWSLWEACCAWASGARRTALLCWRLRWLRATLLPAELEGGDGAEVRRVRAEGRDALRRLAGDAPLPFGEWARLERRCSGRAPALRAAAAALRAALRDPSVPHHHLLYLARVVCEVDAEEAGAVGAEGRRALVAAVLRTRPDGAGAGDGGAGAEADALRVCEERCTALERELSATDGEGDGEGGEAGHVEAVLLPTRGEWGAVRALLAGAARRRALLDQLVSNAHRLGEGALAARYVEQGAAVLCAGGAAGAGAARALLPACAHSVHLALAGAAAAGWGALPQEERVRALAALSAPASDCVALGAALPPLVRAARADWRPPESLALARALRRLPIEGAVLWAVRLEAEARAPRPRHEATLYGALDALPADKWLHVRGAAWCAAEAPALADMLLDKQLRVHALRDELHALPPLAPPAAPGDVAAGSSAD